MAKSLENRTVPEIERLHGYNLINKKPGSEEYNAALTFLTDGIRTEYDPLASRSFDKAVPTKPKNSEYKGNFENTPD